MSDIKITIQEVYTDQIKWEDTAITDIGLWYKEDQDYAPAENNYFAGACYV